MLAQVPRQVKNGAVVGIVAMRTSLERKRVAIGVTDDQNDPSKGQGRPSDGAEVSQSYLIR